MGFSLTNFGINLKRLNEKKSKIFTMLSPDFIMPGEWKSGDPAINSVLRCPVTPSLKLWRTGKPCNESIRWFVEKKVTKLYFIDN
jgi:hypothetical protein